MRGYHGVWLTRHTDTLAENVSDAIEPDVREAGLLERGLERLCALGFMKRRRRDLTKANLVSNDLRLVGFERGEKRLVWPLRSGKSRYEGEPERRNRARDHSTDGTAIQTTEELSKQAKKIHSDVFHPSRRTSIVIEEIAIDADRLRGYENC